MNSFVEQAKAEGVPVLAEGQSLRSVPTGGYLCRRLSSDLCHANSARLQEVFGPVLSAFPFEDEADAIALANGTDYGLLAAVWTRDGSRMMRVANAVRCGQVFVNGYGAGGGIELPFGGVKRSGHGREKGFLRLAEFSVAKTIVHQHG